MARVAKRRTVGMTPSGSRALHLGGKDAQGEYAFGRVTQSYSLGSVVNLS